MEIRLLYRNEVQMAVYTAHEVFEACVKPYAKTAQEVEWYYSYVRVENLWQEMSAGRLFLWGAFEGGQMCAVSAMQDAGHITMLYVKPQYMKRRIGTQLIDQMCSYAAGQLRKQCVTVNAMPISVASFFYHIGFVLTQGAPLGNSYVPLERRIWAMPGAPLYGNMTNGASVYGYPQQNVNMGYQAAYAKPKRPEVTYPTKKVSPKCIAWIVAAVLLFSTVVTVGVTVHHIVTDGVKTESQQEEKQKTAFRDDFVINV